MTDIEIKGTPCSSEAEKENGGTVVSAKIQSEKRGDLLEAVKDAKKDLGRSESQTTVDETRRSKEYLNGSERPQYQSIATTKKTLNSSLEAVSQIEVENQEPVLTPRPHPHRLSAEINELLEAIRSGDIIDILYFMKTHDVVAIASAYKSTGTESLETIIKKADPEFDDGSIHSFLKDEIIETCAHLLARAIRKGQLSSQVLAELGDLLSNPEIQGVIQAYGAMFVANLHLDILKSLPEIDRFETAPILSSIFGSEEEVLRYLKDEISKEQGLDPATRIIDSASIALQDAAKKIEEALQEIHIAGQKGGAGVRGVAISGIKDASRQLRMHAEAKREKAKMRRIFRVATAVCIGILVAVFGNANSAFRVLVPCLLGYGAWLASSVPQAKNSRAGRRRKN